MNFLLRQSTTAAAVASEHQLPPAGSKTATLKRVTTLEGLIAEDRSPLVDYWCSNQDRGSDENDSMSIASSSSNFASYVDSHVDVMDDEGFIAIPLQKLSDDWGGAPDMHWFHSLDRSFVFPGEQVHVVACLSASKQNTDIITPFKLAAVMNKNGSGQGAKNKNGDVVRQESLPETPQVDHDGLSETSQVDHVGPSETPQVDHDVLYETLQVDHDGQVDAKSESDPQVNQSASESFLRMQDHRRQTQTLLQRFKDSHFFVRIADSGEQLWSERSQMKVADEDSMEEKTAGLETSINAVIDSGRFDARVSGGAARNSVKCCSLANGDIVVLLQVNIGVDSLNDPVLEILQFEKHHDTVPASETAIATSAEYSPYGDLLKWLLPLNNSQLLMNRPLSPPLMNISHKSSFSSSTGSQLFSFGHFRSNSMSALPLNAAPAASPHVSVVSLKPIFDLEDWDNCESQNFLKNLKTGNLDWLSFRGVPLEPERFSACCGLEGIYVPGRRWRKRLEIIQPVVIHTFAADCNTSDLVCVQVKNVSPMHVPEIIVYIDAITIVLEEASKAGPPLSVPIACIEAGTDHSLPNLTLRRGEEHSFILKPVTSFLKNSTTRGEKITGSLRPKAGSRAASMRLPLKLVEAKRNISSSDKYAVLVSCRCNYSGSRLFFKKPIDWKPRISRDLMISVTSEISQQNLNLSGRVSQLPVQVLTLQASNLASEDLTLTILAPASFSTPPSVVSLNSTPSSPISPFSGFPTTPKPNPVTHLLVNQKQNATESLPFAEQEVPVTDAIPTAALSCTHLWLQSRVPLGSVPSHSTASIKLELLPLTDGIITLDTLQIYAKEKGLTYIPERALKINATSSIATGEI